MSTLVLSRDVDVALPAHRLAAVVLDWRRDPLWRAQVRSFAASPDSRAVTGQQLVEELVFAGLTFRTTTVVDRAEPLAASYAGQSRSVRVRGHRVVTPVSSTTSRVRLHTEIELLGALRLLQPLLAPSYRRTDAADAAHLAEIAVEAANRVGAA
ncbi:hypothetical protein G5V58_02910 [Nocardioides anomalus]|uniref:SRPBCC family protein n=1 Tax=Nocardioides anomalus TaxID=2712223 RepID=A0A6G6WA06_9ACTN|nr:hypothetical protein [Nocardioides anomalus]QIG41870.1 hypothetical protein G5V58_02910 [Nocardioides anomalus]